MSYEPDPGGASDAPDGLLEELIAHVGLSVFPDNIQQEVDDLLAAGQSLEPEARQRFIQAAARGTHDRSLRSRGALETLLFETRRAAGMQAEELAAEIDMTADTVRAIERGELPLRSGDPISVAAWAVALELDRGLVAGALRRSLARPMGEPAYAGERTLRLTPDQQAFLEDVLRAFDERTNATPTE